MDDPVIYRKEAVFVQRVSDAESLAVSGTHVGGALSDAMLFLAGDIVDEWCERVEQDTKRDELKKDAVTQRALRRLGWTA